MALARTAHALRLLRQSPGFTLTATLILALGIGANTAVFSVVDTVLLRALPYRNSNRLVLMWQSLPGKGLSQVPVSQADYLDFRASAHSFDEMAAMFLDKEEYGVTGLGEPEQVRAMAVSANLFSLLGISPAIGRDFLPNEDQAGNERRVILSDGFWRRHFGNDRTVVGRTMMIDATPHTIIGIMPRGFVFPPPVKFAVGGVSSGQEFWVPCVLERANRDNHPLAIVARLKYGVSAEQADKEVSAIAALLAKTYPRSNEGVGATVSPMLDQVVRYARPSLLLLLAGVGCVLLIGCVNIANLLLARATVRRKELAVRAALGAGRAELIKQVLTENLLLALLGGCGGALLAVWGVDALRSLADIGIPRLAEVHVDWRLFAFAGILSAATGLLTGILPALGATRIDLIDSLKDAGRSLGSRRHNRVRDALAVVEIALALVLLVAAGLLIRSFGSLLQIDPGFQPDRILTLDLRLPHSHYADDAHVAAFETQLLDRVARLPGVTSAASVNSLPIAGFEGASTFRIEGRPAPQSMADSPLASERVISPAYFRTMGIPIQRGRAFTAQDQAHSTPVVIVSQSVVKRYMGGEDPIGKRIQMNDSQQPWMTVVGVVGDVRQAGLAADAGLALYVPYTQDTWSVMSLVVRTQSRPEALAAALRSQVWAIDRDQPVAHMSTMEKILADSLAGRRFQWILLGVFASVALLLALVGIYGVISYSVVHRTNEIALRMALGARPADVFRGVLRHGLTLALAGAGIGLAAALAVTRGMAVLLFQVRPTDPATLAVVSAAVLATALVASYVPARRATRIDPAVALREEQL